MTGRKSVTVNGEKKEVAAATILELLQAEGLDPARRGIAVALDGAVVSRADWAGRPLSEGSVVEIVKPAAGG
jgi:sulfur carrier protein